MSCKKSTAFLTFSESVHNFLCGSYKLYYLYVLSYVRTMNDVTDIDYIKFIKIKLKLKKKIIWEKSIFKYICRHKIQQQRSS